MTIGRSPGLIVRAAVLAVLILGAWPASALAEWVVTPFVGLNFESSTNLVDLASGTTRSHATIGGSAGWLGDGLLGIEANVAHTPHFFEGPTGGLFVDSSLTSVTGDVIIAVPRSIVRESLRPYIVGGVGVMHVVGMDVLDLLSFDANLTGLSLGGGAIGGLSDRTALRFELRYLKNITQRDELPTIDSDSFRLSAWRATVGVTFGY